MIMSAPVCVCDNGRFVYSVMVCKGEKFRFEDLPKVDHSRAQHGTTTRQVVCSPGLLLLLWLIFNLKTASAAKEAMLPKPNPSTTTLREFV